MGEFNDIAQMLALLHELQGIDFVRQLRLITERHEFSPLKDAPQIYTVGSEGSEDYHSLLDAAHKAVEHGYSVFVLPNPKGFRTADFIFERKDKNQKWTSSLMSLYLYLSIGISVLMLHINII
jgi:hypothetical protein